MGLFRRLFGSGLRFPLKVEDLKRGPVNDAHLYGVVVREAQGTPGDMAYRVLRVHHLTPEENRGNHHIYVEVLDENGRRIPGAQVRISWEGGSRVLAVDSDPQRPGIAFPMGKWEVYEVDVLGEASARVVGLTAGHPEEGPGNPEFRHSFLVVFQRARIPVEEAVAPAPSESQLPSVGEEEEVRPLPTSEVETPPPAEPAEVEETAPAEVAPVPEETVRPTPPAETTAVPGIEEETVPDKTAPAPEARAEPAPVAETAAAPTVEKQPGRLFDTYVLFVDAEAPSTLAAFFVAMDEILSAGVPFGFDTVDVAALARRVIVVGELPADTLAHLRQQCEEVITIEGDGAMIREGLQDSLSVG